MEDRQGPRMPRPGLATTIWPALARMARGSRLLVAFLALALLATATRVLPPLAIGLVVDRVGANRAHATLAAIVAGLCALALAELALAAARDEAGLALRGRGAPAFPGSGADARAGAAVALELAEAATCVPVLALAVIGCLSLAGTRVAAAAACIALAYLVASAILVAARGEAAWRLHEAPRAGLAAGALALDRGRAAARRMLGLVGRLGNALALGLCALEVIAGALAPGGLIMALLLLRQLQAAAEAASGTWLRAVELVPRLAAGPRGAAS
jgi:hypothetical protein